VWLCACVQAFQVANVLRSTLLRNATWHTLHSLSPIHSIPQRCGSLGRRNHTLNRPRQTLPYITKLQNPGRWITAGPETLFLGSQSIVLFSHLPLQLTLLTSNFYSHGTHFYQKSDAKQPFCLTFIFVTQPSQNASFTENLKMR